MVTPIKAKTKIDSECCNNCKCEIACCFPWFRSNRIKKTNSEQISEMRKTIEVFEKRRGSVIAVQ